MLGEEPMAVFLKAFKLIFSLICGAFFYLTLASSHVWFLIGGAAFPTWVGYLSHILISVAVTVLVHRLVTKIKMFEV